MYKISVVTATRAEYGLLSPLLYRLKQNRDVELQIVVTGAHLNKKFGNTYKEIIDDGFTDFYRIELPLNNDSKMGMAIATGIAVQKFAALFEELNPDVVVLLGDRYEILGVATAAHLMTIPIAHMCGGDITEGAVDDAIRHCLTKLSILHFPSCKQAAQRIIQMGENPAMVFNVGEPGIENCLSAKLLTREELASQIRFDGILGDYCVVTYHPVTLVNNSVKEQIAELIEAMDSFPKMSYVITKANADAGGRMINEVWEREGASRGNWLVISSLGMVRYLSAVKNARLVIGNSSSGLVEVPALGVPTINIGDRQKGRMMAASVISCVHKSDEIRKAMNHGLSSEFRASIVNIELPFGNGTTSKQVEEELIRFLRTYEGTIRKRFFDLNG